MVVYELLLAVAVNTLLFIDGSRFSVVQVRAPPCTSPHCYLLPLLPSCCMAFGDASQQANPLHLLLCSLCCMIPWDASQLANPLRSIGMISVALTRSWRLIDVLALVNPETSVLTLNVIPTLENSETCGDPHAAETLKCMSQLGLAVVLTACRCSTLLAGCLLLKTEMQLHTQAALELISVT